MTFERWIAVLGVCGTIVGLAVPLAYQRVQARHQTELRLRDDRREVYGVVMAVIDYWQWTFSEHEGASLGPTRCRPETHWEEAISRARLLGGDEVCLQLDRVDEVMFDGFVVADQGSAFESRRPSMSVVRRDLAEAVEELRAAIRVELGVRQEREGRFGPH